MAPLTQDSGGQRRADHDAMRDHKEQMTEASPIPQNYLTHQAQGTWQSASWQKLVQQVLTDQEMRLAYD